MILSLELLKKIYPKGPKNLSEFVVPLNDAIQTSALFTPLRLVHFLTQIGWESNQLSVLEEDLWYSADALTKKYGRFFSSAEAKTFARNPPLIANRIYAMKYGNGDEKSGDGWRFRGRSPIQLSCRRNYEIYSKKLNVDIVENPDLVKQPDTGMKVAALYWDDNNINIYADKDDDTEVRRKINRGLWGLDECIALKKHILEVLQ